MNPGLLLKSLREVWLSTLLLGAAVGAIEAVFAYVLPTYFSEFAGQLIQIPFFQTVLKALLGIDMGDLAGPDAFTAMAWVHPVVLALVWAHAIVLCTRMPAGEIDRGTIDVLFGLPVSRWQAYRSDLAVLVAAGLAVLAMALLGNFIGSLWLEAERRPDAGGRLVVVANLFCLYLAVGGLTCLVSSLSTRRGRAVAIVFALLLGSFLLNFLAQLWGPAEHLSFLSLLKYYRPFPLLQVAAAGSEGGGPLVDMAVLLAIAALCWTAGGLCLARRDISTL